MDDRPVSSARSIAYYANCTSADLDKLTACLRAASPQALLSAHNQYLVSTIDHKRTDPTREAYPMDSNTDGNGSIVLWSIEFSLAFYRTVCRHSK